MNLFIHSLRYSVIFCLIIALSACDILTPTTPASESCKEIAQGRLKHPESFRENAQSETISREGQIEVRITFHAWNDYKVPLPFSIACVFQDREDGTLSPVGIKWNGRPLRRHELDDIRQSLNN